MTRWLTSLLVVAWLAPGATALASPTRNALRLDAGFASAVGELGLTYTRGLGSMFQIEAGAGVGFSGIQLSLMPKLSIGGERHRYVGGVGVAASLWPGHGPDESPAFAWLNADVLGYEYREGRFTLLAAIGLTVGLAGQYAWEDETELVRGSLMPQARVGMGYCF